MMASTLSRQSTTWILQKGADVASWFAGRFLTTPSLVRSFSILMVTCRHAGFDACVLWFGFNVGKLGVVEVCTNFSFPGFEDAKNLARKAGHPEFLKWWHTQTTRGCLRFLSLFGAFFIFFPFQFASVKFDQGSGKPSAQLRTAVLTGAQFTQFFIIFKSNITLTHPRPTHSYTPIYTNDPQGLFVCIQRCSTFTFTWKVDYLLDLNRSRAREMNRLLQDVARCREQHLHREKCLSPFGFVRFCRTLL